MATLNDITSSDWTLSDTTAGAVVQGINATLQRMRVLFRTQQGSDPLRPSFGLDFRQLVDRPVTDVAALLKSQVRIQVAQFITEAEITRLIVTRQNGNLVLTVEFTVNLQGAPTAGSLTEIFNI